MAVYLSPGVYTREIDLSLYTPNLSTTAVGMVGYATKGPLDVDTFISDPLQFASIFGDPDPTMYGPYAALQYLNQGRQLHYVRVAAKDETGATLARTSEAVIYEKFTPAKIVSVGRNTAAITAANKVITISGTCLTGGNSSSAWTSETTLDIGAVTSVLFTMAQIATALNNNPQFSQFAVAQVNGTSGADNFGKIEITSIYKGTLATTSSLFTATVPSATGSIFKPVQLRSLPSITFPLTFTAESVDPTDRIFEIGDTAVLTDSMTLVRASSADSFTLTINGPKVWETNLKTLAPVTVYLASVTPKDESSGTLTSTAITDISPDGKVLTFTVSGNTKIYEEQPVSSVTINYGPFYVRVCGPTTTTFTAVEDLVHVLNDFADIADGYSTAATPVQNFTFNHRYSAVVATTKSFYITVTNTVNTSTTITIYHSDSTYSIHKDEQDYIAYSATPVLFSEDVDGTVTAATISPVQLLSVAASSEGTWGNNLGVGITNVTSSTFDLLVYNKGNLVERFTKLVRVPQTLGYNPDGSVIPNPSYVETIINNNSSYITVTDTQKNVTQYNSHLPETISTYRLLYGGTNGLPTSTADVAHFVGLLNETEKTGLQIFRNPEEVDINLLVVPGISEAAVINEMITICETRLDCMAVIDPPRNVALDKSLTPQQVVSWHNGTDAYTDHVAFNTSYAALYWPWLQIYDPVNNVKVWTPPSGHMIAAYAYNDNTAEVWYAPAGLNRGHLSTPLKADYNPTKGEHDLLYGDGNAVNPIATFKQDGLNIWGQRTLKRTPSALDRVNVRRLLLYLEKVLATATRSLVFEPNDSSTWLSFRNLVTPLLDSVKTRRGITEFKVVCDATVNTPDVIERNEMKAMIYIKPTKTAEFIQLNFIVTSQNSSFEELVF